MDPTQIYKPINTPVLAKDGKMVPVWWKFFLDIVGGLTTIDLTSQVTGVLPVVNGGTGSSIAIRHQRVTTGIIGAGVSALVTLTWTAAFATANYTAVVSVLDATAATASLSVVHIETQSATAIAVRVLNSSAGNLTGTLQALAIVD